MRVKVDLHQVVIDQEDINIQEGDVKIENKQLKISFAYFKELEEIFKLVRKGLDDFTGDFEFNYNKR